MKTDNCSCNTAAAVCRSTAGERPRYFPRQLVTAEDMMLEQEYFRNRMRLHNRLMHGWGVVCGLQVAPAVSKESAGSMAPWKVTVCHGHALGPYGDDITVPCEVEIDLRQDSVAGSSIEPCDTVADVWCSEVLMNRGQDQELYLAIRYAEVPTRPVRMQPAGCGCDDTACEYSRLRDGYVIKVLTVGDYRKLAAEQKPAPLAWPNLFKEEDPHPGCWHCSEHPWVVLAHVKIDAGGKITEINNRVARRLVAALGGFYWSRGINVKIMLINGQERSALQRTPIPLERGTTPNVLTVAGQGFDEDAGLSFGDGVSLTIIEKTADSENKIHTLKIEATVASNAAPGKRNVTVSDPDCTTDIWPGVLEVPPVSTNKEVARERPLESTPVEKEKTTEGRPRRRS